MTVVSSKQIMVCNLVAKYGEPVTWRQVTTVANTSGQPWNPTAGEPTDYPITMMFQPFARLNYETERLRPRLEVPKELAIGYFQSTGFTPSLQDVILRGSLQYGIEFINMIDTGATLLYYEVMLIR
jgi:hypothetical protein